MNTLVEGCAVALFPGTVIGAQDMYQKQINELLLTGSWGTQMGCGQIARE